MESIRSIKITDYLKGHPEQKIKGQTMFIAYGGTVHPHEIYAIPIKEYLFHNIRNGRFRAELLEREEELKRKLDPTKESDAQIITKLLLEQNLSETNALAIDIEKNGQLEPGIITYDGAVINANRRMAIINSLYEKTREDKYKYLKVGILPPGVNQIDLWKIEAGLQFGRDFRLQYGGVNELLKLREGESQGLSPKEISVALTGRFTDKQVTEKLEILRLIDSYLTFINKKNEYHRITESQALEKFNSLQKNVISPLKNKHDFKKRDIAELTAVAFALIAKTDVTHWDIRELKTIATNPKSKNELLSPFNNKIPSSGTEINLSREKLTEAYTTAREVVENEKEKDKPERLLKRAKSALEGVNDKSPRLKELEIQDLLKGLQNRIVQLIDVSKKA